MDDRSCPRCGGKVIEDIEGHYCLTCDWSRPAPIRYLTEVEKNTERPEGFKKPKRIPHPDGRDRR
jgi:hypothetical protein